MVVNQLECCGNSSSSSRSLKMVVSEAPAATETWFVAKSSPSSSSPAPLAPALALVPAPALAPALVPAPAPAPPALPLPLPVLLPSSRSSASSPSPYTWLDKLRFLKGFPEEPRVELSEFLTSLAVLNSSSSSSKTVAPAAAAAAAPAMVQQQRVLEEKTVSRTFVKANGIFYMDLGASETNGNAREMEIQKWGIRARTSRLNASSSASPAVAAATAAGSCGNGVPYGDQEEEDTTTTTVCVASSNCMVGGQLLDASTITTTTTTTTTAAAATAAEGGGIADNSKQRNCSSSKFLDSFVNKKSPAAAAAGKPPPVPSQLMMQYSPLDLFGMEDRRSSSSIDSRKKLSRKGNKLSFLPRSSSQQLGKEEAEEEEEEEAMDLSLGEGNNLRGQSAAAVVQASSLKLGSDLVHHRERQNPSFFPPHALLPFGSAQGVGFVPDGFKQRQQQQGVWSSSSEQHNRHVLPPPVDSSAEATAYKGARSSINKLAKRLRTNVAATSGASAAAAAAASQQQLKRKATAASSNHIASAILERRRTGSNFLNNSRKMAGKRRADSELLVPQTKDQACKVLKVGEPWVAAERSTERRSGTGTKSIGAGHDGGAESGKGGPSPQEAAAAPVLELASDHPSKKSKDSLVYITYQVFLQAGKAGLTAREAASRIIDCGLADIFHGLIKPRIKIGKIIRNNPYYFQAGEGRYILFEAIVGVTQTVSVLHPPPPPPTTEHEQSAPARSKLLQKETAASATVDARKEAAAMARRNGTARYWAQMHANGWTRGSKGRNKKPAEMGKSAAAPAAAASPKVSERPPVQSSGDTADRKLQLEEQARQDAALEQAAVEGQMKQWQMKGAVHMGKMGKQCRRSDGKNWQCPEWAVSGTNYCGNHQYSRMKQAAVETKGVFRTPSLSKDTDETNERRMEGYDVQQDQNTE